MENQNLILEIVKQVMYLNSNTDLALFFDISGHVDTISVDVCEDKEVNYKKRLASFQSVSSKDFDGLLEIYDTLKTFS